jgi:hypothetical protein
MNKLFFYFFLINTSLTFSQYATGVGEIGSTAIFRDSSLFQFWADSAILSRGWQNISDKNSGLATVGDVVDGLGIPDNKVVSLGDSGVITLSFPHRIQNGVGPDFAVFENGFNNTFLELAHVEVSTDGIHFVRFPSVSLSSILQQFGNDAIMDATKLNNLAGKYKGGYGTPFDLEELKDSSYININNIQFIRLIDVVGSINPKYGTKDSKGVLINDPFPTPYPSSGFDLDAVGVINSEYASQKQASLEYKFWPNPAQSNLYIVTDCLVNIELYNSIGEIVFSEYSIGKCDIDISAFRKGIYFLKIGSKMEKIINE